MERTVSVLCRVDGKQKPHQSHLNILLQAKLHVDGGVEQLKMIVGGG